MSTSSQLLTALEKLNAALDEAEAAAEARRAADAAQESSAPDSSGLESALAELRSDYANLKAAAAEETEESSIKNRNIMEKLEDTFRKREENLESSMKDQGIALQKALANEVRSIIYLYFFAFILLFTITKNKN